MIPLFSVSQIRGADDFAINSLRIPSLMLMENASMSIFSFLKNELNVIPDLGKIGIVCGKGNNGGDGFALARHLISQNYNVIIISIGDKEDLSNDAKTNLQILENFISIWGYGKLIKFQSQKDLKKLDDCIIVFDALLGTGTKGELKSPYDGIINYLNGLNSIKIAIDIPSGLNSDTGYSNNAFYADYTITLADFKKGLFIGKGKSYSGKVVKGNIGIGEKYFEKQKVEDYLIEPEDVNDLLPQKENDIHKYSYGTLLVIAGSSDLPGAAFLSAQSALKSGAGAVYLAVPKSTSNILRSKLNEVIIKEYDDNDKGYLTFNNFEFLNSMVKDSEVIIIGPGLGRNEETLNTIQKLVEFNSDKKFVLDADGIYALKNIYKKINLSNCVLTPHLGEFAKLINVDKSEIQKDLLKYGKKFSFETESLLILKGSPTIIFTPEGESLINTTGNRGMAKFGSGDVLTGMTGSFLLQTADKEQSAILSVYLHSLSADLKMKKLSEFSLTATDIISGIPSAISFIRGSIV